MDRIKKMVFIRDINIVPAVFPYLQSRFTKISFSFVVHNISFSYRFLLKYTNYSFLFKGFLSSHIGESTHKFSLDTRK